MAIEDFPAGERPFRDSKFRDRLNRMKDAINEMMEKSDDKPIIFDFDDSGSNDPVSGPYEVWINILGHQDDIGRKWLYEWEASYVNPDDPHGAFLPDPAIRWNMEIEPGLDYGLAINVAERESGITLQRPLRTGSVVRGFLFIGTDASENKVVQMVFSATNNERQFFAEITGFSGGYYSWTEVYPDGTAIAATDSPQSGSNAVNSYYGPGDITHVVSNGRVVLMEHLASDVSPNLVGFCVPLEGENLPMVGDEMGYPAPATIPDIYPPYSPADNPVQVGGDGAWIEVWEVDDPASVTIPKERIRRIYHLEPSTPATDQEFNTCLAEVADGGDPDGGGAGSISFEDILVEPDAMGHIFSAEPELTPSSLAAGAGLVINGTGKAGTIKHSNPGAAVNTMELSVSSAEGGVSLGMGGWSIDSLGHVFENVAFVAVTVIGDEWIDVAQGTPADKEILLTHQPAQADGAKKATDPMVTVINGSIAGEGGIAIQTVNPYIDSKGHVNAGLSSVEEAAITAGNKIKITGSGDTAAIHFVDATAGSPTLVDNVVTDLAFSIVGSNLRITVTKKPLNKTVDSYGNVTDVSTGTATTSDLDVPIGEC